MDDETLTFILNAEDNVTPVTEEIAAGQDSVAESTARAQSSIDSQNISFMTQMHIVSGLHRGNSEMITGLKSLGLVSAGTAAELTQVNSGIGLVLGAFQTLRAVTAIIDAVRDSELALAAVETFRSVLANPADLALIGVAGAAAAGVGGYLMMQGSSGSGTGTTVNQSVTYAAAPTPDQVSATESLYTSMGGTVR